MMYAMHQVWSAQCTGTRACMSIQVCVRACAHINNTGTHVHPSARLNLVLVVAVRELKRCALSAS